ncbi:hypothetical protein SARC_13868 [Sphaeroforma arctica JP610]|uniref:Uncharacterized protein n=1 Tax=Sphaeroforma arctica JP610 TaxID=667725 RepID=A0A0L0FA32_9EUKA|nr:hypothetical protein SARC_13868 [Sphaeroforma arctica JP610]KNC73574.1 hypothetical protein SARC_13868 [Sphaeroforma arctica JP610]|eukprot:XP_014147476.1 hypothetical protein SARC_13868 [Sphaeroforma arctica JP610]
MAHTRSLPHIHNTNATPAHLHTPTNTHTHTHTTQYKWNTLTPYRRSREGSTRTRSGLSSTRSSLNSNRSTRDHTQTQTPPIDELGLHTLKVDSPSPSALTEGVSLVEDVAPETGLTDLSVPTTGALEGLFPESGSGLGGAGAFELEGLDLVGRISSPVSLSRDDESLQPARRPSQLTSEAMRYVRLFADLSYMSASVVCDHK